jgi:hypothetical protein
MGDGELNGEWVRPAGVVERCAGARAVGQAGLDGVEKAYGYGWMTEQWLGQRILGHGGSMRWFCSFAGYLTETGLRGRGRL